MGAVSSANPEDLERYVSACLSLNESLRKQAEALIEQYHAYAATPSDYRVDLTHVLHDLTTRITANGLGNQWVQSVAHAFRKADASGGLATTSDAQIAKALLDSHMSEQPDGRLKEVLRLQTLAKQYADKLKNNQKDGSWAKGAHSVASEVAQRKTQASVPYMDDPYFAAAFYGELGPLTQALPDLLRASGRSTAGEDLKNFSHLFGTAVSNSADDPGMGAVMHQFLRRPAEPVVSYNRAVMCSNGSFPPDWLAKAARVNALDDFAKYGALGYHGSGFDRINPINGVDLPLDTVGAWTKNLGGNPDAAREALATMGNPTLDVTIHGDPTVAYHTNIHKLIVYGKSKGAFGEVARGYGPAFEAASGADNEVDGSHSKAAITFSKALFNVLGHDGGDVQPVAAQNFAKIGASYVQEMAAGYDQQGTQVSGVDDEGRLAGDHAAFAVPPKLATNFMKTFVGNPAATKIFDTAAGQAAHHAMLTGAQGDVLLLKQRLELHMLGDASDAYGSVAGSEHNAAVQVIGKEVQDEKHAAAIMKGILSAGIDAIPGGKIPDLLWEAAKYGAHHKLDDIFDTETVHGQQLKKLENQGYGYDIAMTDNYERTAILREARYPGTDKIPKELLDVHGHMLDVSEVMRRKDRDGKLYLKEAYYNYMHSRDARQAEGSLGRGASVYKVAHIAAERYRAAYNSTR